MIMFGVVPTATSESTLKDIYDELVICSVPFPGLFLLSVLYTVAYICCFYTGNEFFREWCVNNLSGESSLSLSLSLSLLFSLLSFLCFSFAGQKQVYHWECGIFFNIPPPYDKELPPLGWDTMKEWDISALFSPPPLSTTHPLLLCLNNYGSSSYPHSELLAALSQFLDQRGRNSLGHSHTLRFRCPCLFLWPPSVYRPSFFFCGQDGTGHPCGYA